MRATPWDPDGPRNSSRCRSLEVPAKVALRPADLLAGDREHLGVAEPVAVCLRVLVGHHDLVARLDEAHELDALDELGVWPAALEVARPVDSHVGRAVEREVVAQELLDHIAIAGLICPVGVASELQTVLLRHVTLLAWLVSPR